MGLIKEGLRLCRSALFSEPTEYGSYAGLKANDWEELLAFASQQGVLPLVTSHFSKWTVDSLEVRKVLVRWFATAQGNRQRYLLRLHTMQEMSSMFGSRGIEVMFFKGVQLAQLYPNPEWRVFSDIDYYLFGRSAKGIDVLADKGIENKAYYHHHTQASLNGVLLENHYDFVERVNHKCNQVLDDTLKELASKEGHSVPASFLGKEYTNAYVMTPTMNAIFLMRHMSAHFVGETVPLRQLYDWALFLRRYGKHVDWERVIRLYDAAGLSMFASIVQALVWDYLKIDVPSCPIVPQTGYLAERVWRSIVSPHNQDPYRKFSLRYFVFEARTFINNRWKHKIVYPDESYLGLFFRYTWSVIKKKLGLLKMEG